MSDNQTPIIGHGNSRAECSETLRNQTTAIVQDVERSYESRPSGMGPRIDIPQPPAPRLSEEEIQRVALDIYRTGSEERGIDELAAILRTLNEEKKA